MATARIVSQPASGRTMRRPQHTFHLHQEPWQIQPFMLAPVLAGETMKNMLLQSRAVTDPIKNPLMGWWLEYYVFYVKLRDLYDRDLLSQMIVDPSADLTSLDSASAVKHYHVNPTADATGIDWTKLCLERVVDEYFRFTGEQASDYVIDGVPLANVNVLNYTDSIVNDADYIVAYNETLTGAGSEDGTAVTIAEIHNAQARWDLARMNGLTTLTFEEYLAEHGVRTPSTEIHKPELIRYVRDWQYPSNTVDPSNGAPRSAVSWVTQERADKDRYFTEPGFIFGVSCVRPKVYMKNLRSSAAGLMNTAKDWLPPMLAHDPHYSMRKITEDDPPVAATDDDYWIDLKDLLLYGDQFLNVAPGSVTAVNMASIPNTSLSNIRYALETDADACFVSPTVTGAYGDTQNKIRQDGIVSLTIAGRQKDTSPNIIGTDYLVRPT